MERFLAICHPLHLTAMSGFKRAVRIIAALWTVSLIGAIPFGLLTDIQYLNYPLSKHINYSLVKYVVDLHNTGGRTNLQIFFQFI